MARKARDRMPEILAKYRKNATFHRAADMLFELKRAGMSDQDVHDTIRMAKELDAWSQIDRMREQFPDAEWPGPDTRQSADVLPMEPTPESVTASRANLPGLLQMRSDPDARSSARKCIAIIREHERP